MEDLKAIWNKLDDLQLEIGQYFNKNVVETTYATIRKEENLRKKWTPWIIPYILVLMSVMVWISNAFQSWVSMMGILLITIGGFVMTYLLQANRIPVEQYEHNRDAMSFMKLVKEKLERKKHFWAIGVAIYTLSLTFGLHLLIFGFDSLAGKMGYVALLYGLMLGIAGYATGNMYIIHQQRYGGILKTIDRFLAE